VDRQIINADSRGVFVAEFNVPLRAAFDFGSVVRLFEGGRSLVIVTGCDEGPVWMTVDALTEPPPTPDPENLAPWELVEEVSFDPAPELFIFNPGVFTFMAPLRPPQKKAFTRSRPGNHRVRVSCSGRAVNLTRVVEEPNEEYLIQIWPEAEPRPRTQLGGDGLK
jgi:hypothetical protein